MSRQALSTETPPQKKTPPGKIRPVLGSKGYHLGDVWGQQKRRYRPFKKTRGEPDPVIEGLPPQPSGTVQPEKGGRGKATSAGGKLQCPGKGPLPPSSPQGRSRRATRRSRKEPGRTELPLKVLGEGKSLDLGQKTVHPTCQVPGDEGHRLEDKVQAVRRKRVAWEGEKSLAKPGRRKNEAQVVRERPERTKVVGVAGLMNKEGGMAGFEEKKKKELGGRERDSNGAASRPTEDVRASGGARDCGVGGRVKRGGKRTGKRKR